MKLIREPTPISVPLTATESRVVVCRNESPDRVNDVVLTARLTVELPIDIEDPVMVVLGDNTITVELTTALTVELPIFISESVCRTFAPITSDDVLTVTFAPSVMMDPVNKAFEDIVRFADDC